MSDETSNWQSAPATGRDLATIGLLQAGDSDGLQHLFEDHGGIVRSRLRQSFGKVLDDSEIDEVMCLTAVRVWRAAHRVDATLGTLRAWLSVIARNAAIRYLEVRHRARSFEQLTDVDQMAQPDSVAEPAVHEQQELVADMMSCLHQLPPMQRAVLLADLEAGHTAPGEELADNLNTTVSSIYVSRSKGRRSLRQALRQLGHHPKEAKQGGSHESAGEGA